MNKHVIDELRQSARKLIRELGMLELNMSKSNRTPQHWHTLIEVSNEPNITISKLTQLLLLSPSSMSRIVNVLVKEKLINTIPGYDKREKQLQITKYGINELKIIDEYSVVKIKGAIEYLNDSDQHQILESLKKYADALEKSRKVSQNIKIHTLSTSRPIRKQIICMIENIQKNEFNLSITPEINIGIAKAEQEYYYNRSYNFWYATNNDGEIIGSVGLKRIDKNSGEIKKFFVSKSYRGKGLSLKLLQILLKSAHKHNFKTLYLGTVDILHAAHRFYEKNGFLKINKNSLPPYFELCPIDSVFYKALVKDLMLKLVK